MLRLARNAGDRDDASGAERPKEAPVEIVEESWIDSGEGIRGNEQEEDAQKSHGRE
jgi:hypothetical protein